MELNDNITNTIILHHNDMDGFVAAHLLYKELSSHGQVQSIRTVCCSYNKHKYRELFKSDLEHTTVFIVDFSLPIEDMNILIDKVGYSNVTWIDHHESAISLYHSLYPNISFIHFLLIPHGLCGTELTWLYLHGAQTLYLGEDKIVYEDKIYDMAYPRYRDALLEKLPLAIRMVGDYDVWRFIEKEDYFNPVYLNSYFRSHRFYPNKDDELWEPFDATEMNDALKQALYEGEVISNHEVYEYEKLCTFNSFPVTINDYENIEAVAVNNQSYTSRVFDSVFEKYEVGVVYGYLGDKWKYAFYRLGKNPEKEINCARIAAHYGGGGHDSAAGCCVDEDTIVIYRKEETEKRMDGKTVYQKDKRVYTLDNVKQMKQFGDVPDGTIFVIKDASDDMNVRNEEYKAAIYITQRDGFVLVGFIR